MIDWKNQLQKRVAQCNYRINFFFISLGVSETVEGLLNCRLEIWMKDSLHEIKLQILQSFASKFDISAFFIAIESKCWKKLQNENLLLLTSFFGQRMCDHNNNFLANFLFKLCALIDDDQTHQLLILLISIQKYKTQLFKIGQNAEVRWGYKEISNIHGFPLWWWIWFWYKKFRFIKIDNFSNYKSIKSVKFFP